MNSIIQKIQNFIKEERKIPERFENLKIILSKHLISKTKKMKDLDINEFIDFINDIRDYIYNSKDNSKDNSKEDFQKLLDEIENFLFENNVLRF